MELSTAINKVKKEYSEFNIKQCVLYKDNYVFLLEPKGFQSNNHNFVLDSFVIVNDDGSIHTFSPIEDLAGFANSEVIKL